MGFFDEFRISTAISPARDTSTLPIFTESIGISLSLMELSDELVDLTFIVPSGDPVEGFVAVTQLQMTLMNIRKKRIVFIVAYLKNLR
jgi:hypothetical protein